MRAWEMAVAALAYIQAVPTYPELGQKGFAVLEQAAREFPDDAEVQAAYGLVFAHRSATRSCSCG